MPGKCLSRRADTRIDAHPPTPADDSRRLPLPSSSALPYPRPGADVAGIPHRGEFA